MKKRQHLTFGSLSRLCLKYCSEVILTPVYDEDSKKTIDKEKIKTQFNVMSNIFTVIFGTNEIYFTAPQDKGYRNKLLHEKISIPDYLSNLELPVEKSKKMIDKYIVPYIEYKEYFLKDLSKIINNMTESVEKYALNSYFIDGIETIVNQPDKISNIFLACLQIALKIENNCSKNEKEDQFFDLGIDDPHGRDEKTSLSSAVQIQVTIGEEETHTFYDFRRCVDFIVKKNLKIVFVNCIYPKIFVDTELLENSLTIRRVEEEDYLKVYELIKRYNSEFKPKVSWKGRTLYDMALNGLQSQKWSGWGYFDENGEIVGYVDEKIRTDAAIEIGIEVVDPKYRKQHLASSLLFLLKLENPNSIFYAGTFEENDSMIATFVSTGYVPNRISFTVDGKKTHRLKERISVEHKDDYKYYTYSVYYKAESLFDMLRESEVR